MYLLSVLNQSTYDEDVIKSNVCNFTERELGILLSISYKKSTFTITLTYSIAIT